MKVLNEKNWKVILLLSIVVPVGLLVTSRLAGISNEPSTIVETTMQEVAKWEFERPSFDLNLWDYVERLYQNDIFINQSVFIDDFDNDTAEAGDLPILTMSVSLIAALTENHIEDVKVTFHGSHLNSFVWMPNFKLREKSPQAEWRTVWENLSLISYEDGRFHGMGNTEKAFANFKGVDYPKKVHLTIVAQWVLRSFLNQTESLTVRLEVTYFNGTVYKKVVQPFEVKLVPDDNNSFENAEEISFGQSDEKHVLGGADVQDFYKIYLKKDDIIHATMIPPYQQDFDLYLYSSADKNNPVASSAHRRDTVESIDYSADYTGWWFIKVQHVAGRGIYTLTVTTPQTEET